MTRSFSQEDALEQLVASHAEGTLTRRDVLKRGAALGIAVSSVASALAAGGRARGATEAVSGTSAAQAPRRGGTLIEGYDRVFSPITTVNAAWIDPTQDALLESLVTTDPQGKVVPKLAESYSLSEDSKTLTFKLRKGLKFQSGKPVTTADVVGNWNLIRGKNGQDPYWYNQVESIKAGPGNTIVIKCSKPFASGPYLYRQQFANVFNAASAAANPKTYGTKIVDGTGPFTLTGFVANQQVTAKRWDALRRRGGLLVPEQGHRLPRRHQVGPDRRPAKPHQRDRVGQRPHHQEPAADRLADPQVEPGPGRDRAGRGGRARLRAELQACRPGFHRPACSPGDLTCDRPRPDRQGDPVRPRDRREGPIPDDLQVV